MYSASEIEDIVLNNKLDLIINNDVFLKEADAYFFKNINDKSKYAIILKFKIEFLIPAIKIENSNVFKYKLSTELFSGNYYNVFMLGYLLKERNEIINECFIFFNTLIHKKNISSSEFESIANYIDTTIASYNYNKSNPQFELFYTLFIKKVLSDKNYDNYIYLVVKSLCFLETKTKAKITIKFSNKLLNNEKTKATYLYDSIKKIHRYEFKEELISNFISSRDDLKLVELLKNAFHEINHANQMEQKFSADDYNLDNLFFIEEEIAHEFLGESHYMTNYKCNFAEQDSNEKAITICISFFKKIGGYDHLIGQLQDEIKQVKLPLTNGIDVKNILGNGKNASCDYIDLIDTQAALYALKKPNKINDFPLLSLKFKPDGKLKLISQLMFERDNFLSQIDTEIYNKSKDSNSESQLLKTKKILKKKEDLINLYNHLIFKTRLVSSDDYLNNIQDLISNKIDVSCDENIDILFSLVERSKVFVENDERVNISYLLITKYLNSSHFDIRNKYLIKFMREISVMSKTDLVSKI